MTDIPETAKHPSRRGFLGRAALIAAAPTAAAVLVPTLIREGSQLDRHRIDHWKGGP
jgi:hypothetical protein